jgi:hypothetical protein
VPLERLAEAKVDIGLLGELFLFRDLADAHATLKRREVWPEFLPGATTLKLSVLGFWHEGMRQLAAASELRGNFLPVRGAKLITPRPEAWLRWMAGRDPVDQLYAISDPLDNPLDVIARLGGSGEIFDLSPAILDALRDRRPPRPTIVSRTDHAYVGNVLLADARSWASETEIRDTLEPVLDEATAAVNASALAGEKRRIDGLRHETLRFLPSATASKLKWARGTRAAQFNAPYYLVTRADDQELTPRLGNAYTRGIFWNAWFRAREADRVVAAAELAPNTAYLVSLDLSAYALETPSGGPVDAAAVEGRLINYLQRGPSKLTNRELRVRVLASGGTLDSKWDDKLTVDLDQLLRLPGAVELDAEAKVLRGLTEAPTDSAVIGRTAAKVSFVADRRPLQFELRTRTKPGCGLLAFSIWDGAGLVPLDSLLWRFSVGRTAACEADSGFRSMRLEGGLNTLLDPALAGTRGRIDAALHGFDTKVDGTDVTLLVYIDAAARARHADDPAAWDGIARWMVRRPLAAYLANDLPGLVNEVRATKVLATPDGDYGIPANELGRRLFGDLATMSDAALARDVTANVPGDSDASPWPRNEAARALLAMRRMVTAGEGRARLLARIVDAQGRPVYAPLGLLAARSKSRVLPERFLLVQPLTRIRPHREAACVWPWVQAITKSISIADIADEFLSDPPSFPPMTAWIADRRLEDRAKVGELLGSPSSEPDEGGPPEGLLLLAHHDNGFIWFSSDEERTGRLSFDEIRRKVRPGSVAVVAACGTSAGSTHDLLNQLNTLNYDAIVASPFPLDINYGAAFAVAFARTATEARQLRNAGAGWSIADLFEIAGQRAAERLQERLPRLKENPNIDDLSLELQLLGDPDLHVCPHPPS